MHHIVEGHSINCPLYFNGEDYPYWKDRMRLFIESTNLDMWEIIENEDYVLTIEQHVPHVVADLDKPLPIIFRVIPRYQ